MPDVNEPSVNVEPDSVDTADAPAEEPAGVKDSSEKSQPPTPKDVAEAHTPADNASVSDDEPDDVSEDADATGQDTAKVLKALRKKNSENRNLRDRVHAAEQKLMQFQTAAETGLPSELADRLRGDTVEEMKKDAERLRELMGARSVWQPTRGGVRLGDVRSRVEDETDLVKIGERIYNS